MPNESDRSAGELPSKGNGAAKAIIELLQELVATNKRTEESQTSTEKLVAANLRMADNMSRLDQRMARMETNQAALAEIVKNGFDRVGQALEKTNLRIDETNRSVRSLSACQAPSF